ncbi:MAG: class I SAM-dependent methyltransferase family protein [Candidatus Methanoperedens sp.]|jgi:tRNA (guanine37-N1)-methyltransferase|nr:class I SAM-dependent methyltransferase family protein [Candidatus Methanoperedens sp.]PKL53382.1 MAG: class I SAM-dependent methyltransferase family protein [Candidatus Methanoperedenaceae archaeon HGW-Methanoperedenaceae-1]
MESQCISINKRDGEITRRELIEMGALDKNLKIKQDGEHILIPVNKPVEGYGNIGYDDFEEVIKEETPQELLGTSPAYELVGDIAIIDRYESDLKNIAEALVKQKKIRTVLYADTPVSGEYRTRELSYLAGENKTETIYRENKCRYRLDVSKVYFTPRLATERLRIAGQVKNGETVVDMFAGIGPFSILIAKKLPDSHVIAIDKNPEAVRYLRENVELNKLENVEVREGDVRTASNGVRDADHVIMNLPHSGFEFLDVAFGLIKKGGIVHFYAISHEDDLFGETLLKINEIARRCNVSIVPIEKRAVRPYAPYQYNICIDFRVT